MKSSVRIEESKNTKFSNLLQLLLRKITAAVTRREKTEGSKQYEKKISLATIAAGSLLSILIIVLLVLNGWLVGGSGDNFYARQIVLGFLGIAILSFGRYGRVQTPLGPSRKTIAHPANPRGAIAFLAYR